MADSPEHTMTWEHARERLGSLCWVGGKFGGVKAQEEAFGLLVQFPILANKYVHFQAGKGYAMFPLTVFLWNNSETELLDQILLLYEDPREAVKRTQVHLGKLSQASNYALLEDQAIKWLISKCRDYNLL